MNRYIVFGYEIAISFSSYVSNSTSSAIFANLQFFIITMQIMNRIIIETF